MGTKSLETQKRRKTLRAQRKGIIDKEKINKREESYCAGSF